MLRTRATALLLVSATVSLSTACGDDDSTELTATTTTSSSSASATTDASASSSDAASSSSTGHPGPCAYLTPTETRMLVGGAGIGGVDMRVDAPLAGYDKTRLVFELYANENFDPIETGTFDLTAAPDDDYGTCEHCFLLVASDDNGQPRRAFFQSAGSFSFDHFGDDYTMAGSIDDLRLVEVVQSPVDFTWSVVDDGLCFDVAPIAFDTRPIDGGPCEKAEDCPNEFVQTCDVETRTCVQAECLLGEGPFCPETERCMSQFGALLRRDDGGPMAGGCYEQCIPGLSECDDPSMTCLPLGPVQEVGICLPNGTAQVGEACDLPDVSTGCVAGAMCDEPGICREICSFLQPVSGCDVGSYCTPQNICRPLSVGDAAPIGQACAADARFLEDCGPEGDAFRGMCLDLLESGTQSCERWCNVEDPACPGGQECLAVFDNPKVGICHQPGVCGDGVLDLVGGELCDDGNAIDGDGCDTDCVTIELGPLCASAEALVPGMLVVGDTEEGVTGFGSGCSAWPIAPGAAYTFVPPSPGKLKLRLDSTATLVLGVQSDCADPATELACSRDVFQEGSQRLEVNFVTGGDPAAVVVRSETPGDVGAYFLLAEFAPAVCGDGELAGAEVCDDGNTSGGDGCSADCAVVDWMTVCANLPQLDLAAPNEGVIDVTGSEVFALDHFCSNDGTEENAYQFTAPADGTLHLGIASDPLLVVYVGDGCGAIDPAGFLACINWYPAPGETRTTDVPLVAGQRVTVVVEGYHPQETGEYTLTASFGP